MHLILPRNVKARQAVEDDLRRHVEAERQRLEAQARASRAAVHYRRPVERPFTAAERDRVTILFGGLTWKHEWLIRSVFQASGYKVELLPTPDVAAFQMGKEYGNNGQCNPTYFMVGHLIRYLQALEAKGLSRQQVIDNYVFFTAGSCGPCRFGMYEAEYRLAVQNAGYPGFRILLFQQTDGIRATSGELGLKFTVDFGLGALNALTFGDLLNDACCQIRPYEAEVGATDRAFEEATNDLARALRDRRMFRVSDIKPAWLAQRIAAHRTAESTTSVLGKIGSHLWGTQTTDALRQARERLDRVTVDRLRVKPLVKVTGEFFAQTTEGDGNFHMFQFLEREGAEVQVEPIANWIMYLLWGVKAKHARRKWLDMSKSSVWHLDDRLACEWKFYRKQWLLAIGERFYARLYRRLIRELGGIAHELLDMHELADLAQPYYHPFARGGEGHLEVAKNIYYTVHKKAHMVLSLKPFGCMPSSQSDGVQSAVMSHFKDMIFLPIETSGEGEVNAHSRVQMALGEAKAKAKAEFQEVLASTGRRVDDMRSYVDDHPELKRPFYRVPHREGVTGTAAKFVLHVSDLMDRRQRRFVGTGCGAGLQADSHEKKEMMPRQLLIGIDVGSTTVKAVVVDAAADAIVWSDYQRHETKQPEKALEFLVRIEADLGVQPGNCRLFITGSGGHSLAPLVGAKFVQEVTAVSLAVEKLHPEVHSVIELGGQDAKIIVFKEDPETGRKKKIPSMNDKCAGGTGAVIDKINAKLKIPPSQLCRQGYRGIKLHKVAGKCGVFAETDINGLQKMGTPPDELMASLFDAIVLQNLTVLTRGHTLRPHVLLLGGPNTFISGLREAWQHHIPKMWAERGVEIPAGESPETLITTPANAQYFAALGAIEFGREQEDVVGRYLGRQALERYLSIGRLAEKEASGSRGLSASMDELEAFKAQYQPKPFVPAVFAQSQTVGAFAGIDGGSTSTKGVLLSEGGDVLCKAYQLSKGNPIQDTIDIFDELRRHVEGQGARLDILGVGTTGYAKDVLKDVLAADAALVETVAHTESAVKYYDDPHVIVDVGGQDIKLIVLKDGRVKDFKLNTQCSAGNGYFLQATAEMFGIPVTEYADRAFAARAMPAFGYGCAVFMQSDIVNFQRQGWAPEEILAGLAAVLPKNIFLYVASIPNLATLGTRFILQGGTQHNLAAVKAEVDFIRSNFRGADVQPEIIVHEHCGESGAIGAAVEARRLWASGHRTRFVGLEAVRRITYRTTRSESTRCTFCKNTCLRTFIDIKLGATGPEGAVAPVTFVSKVPKGEDEQRLILATCEKGTVEDVDTMRGIKAGVDAVKRANPNFVELAAKEAWNPRRPGRVADEMTSPAWTKAARHRVALMKRRETLRIGMPRALNMYAYAPFFSAYFESLGVGGGNLVYSDYTSAELYREGSARGAIDPCFPSKIGIAHVHNLLFAKHARKALHLIFFPMVDVLHTPLANVHGSNACPTVTVTPETVKAAFTKEGDLFAERGVLYLDPLVNFADRSLLCQQLFEAFEPVLGLSREENARAVDVGFRELAAYEADLQRRARTALEELERDNRLGIVLLARPYHHDPGVNHGILEEFQKLGYPVFSQSCLPLDQDLLDRLFGGEVRAGVISSPLDIQDVWKTSYSASTNHKLWAAKFTARHPNLVALELSSFKCGHDAPIYTTIESIIERSGTPYFSFKDIDENKPAGSIKIRVETIHYFLKRFAENGHRCTREEQAEIARQLAIYEQEVRDQLLREQQLADLAARQREHAPTVRLLPVIPLSSQPADRSTCMNQLDRR